MFPEAICWTFCCFLNFLFSVWGYRTGSLNLACVCVCGRESESDVRRERSGEQLWGHSHLCIMEISLDRQRAGRRGEGGAGRAHPELTSLSVLVVVCGSPLVSTISLDETEVWCPVGAVKAKVRAAGGWWKDESETQKRLKDWETKKRPVVLSRPRACGKCREDGKMCVGARRAKCIYLEVLKGIQICVHACTHQSSLPESLQTRSERIGQMCVTVLAAGFNGQREETKRERSHVLLEICSIATENCTQRRKLARWRGELNGGRQGGEGRKLWKEEKGCTGYRLWEKPIILTIHMCSDESPAKETKWMNSPIASEEAL